MATALVILPTGTYRAEQFLAAARRLGVEVVTASERPQALAETMGDNFLTLPLADPAAAAEAIVRHAGRLPLDAVVAVDDVGLLAAALAAERLGLRHSPPGAVRLTRDKAAMRRAFAAAGVPQPAFEVVASSAEAAAAAYRLGPPVVVKPTSLSASRGVIRADSPEEAGRAAGRIAPILQEAGEPAGSPLLVERFAPGREVAVEAIASRGEVEIVTVFDKPDPLDGPYFEETIYLAPSDLPPGELAAVAETTAAAVAAIGLTEGPVHSELRLPGDAWEGPPIAMLEVAGRTIGGRCAKAFALEGGASLEELVLARALGRPGPPARLAGPAGVLMIPIPASGVLREVRHQDEVRSIAHVSGVEVTVAPGRLVRTLPEGDRYLGFVYAAAPDRPAVERALRQALERLEVVIDTSPPGAPGTVS